MKGQAGFRRLLFAPTDKGFGKWCFEVRKSKAFIKAFASFSCEPRLWCLDEYRERKKLLKQLDFVKSQLGDEEAAYLSLILSGKEKLDHRVPAGDSLFTVWKESEKLLIAEFRAVPIDALSSLKKHRERMNMSKSEIASIVGVSVKTYSSYENGISKIPFIVGLLLMGLVGCIDLQAPPCEKNRGKTHNKPI